MSSLRIWHFLVVNCVAATLFTAARFNNPCTPIFPLLAAMYACGSLGIVFARSKGRDPLIGFWLGFCLGPLGVILAGSNTSPERRHRPAPWAPNGAASAKLGSTDHPNLRDVVTGTGAKLLDGSS